MASRFESWPTTTTCLPRRSKKLSEPKANRPRQRSSLIFFVDRSCGEKKIPDALRLLQLNVVAHRDHFRPAESDVAILLECGRQKWVYVAEDLAVRRNPAELRALNAAAAHAIFLHGRRQPAEYVIRNFTIGLNKILNALETASEPVHLVVKAGGRIDILERV